MNVLVVGSGGREHALAWKIAQSPSVTLYCAPGNPGTAQLAENVTVRPDDCREVVFLARSLGVELVVVGPEKPLVNGVADALEHAQIPVFGPTAAAAAIEGSKAFAKEVMATAGVPTADFRVFDSPGSAEAFARQRGALVVKADGLAAGKGVIVARDATEAANAIRSLRELGAPARRLLLEELLEGEEVSVIALCDGERSVLLPTAQDHKRLGDGDTGPNTGGMGAYSPAPFLDSRSLEKISSQIILPTLAELRRRGTPFRGALYAGLMITEAGPKVLEFNCRLGDPEAQVVLMQVEEDLVPLLRACAGGNLTQQTIRARGGCSVGVVIAAQGYPHNPRTGDQILGLESIPEEVQVFHAGTRHEGGKLVTSGGRVFCVSAHGETVVQARDTAYQAVERIHFRGMHYRKDIAARALAAPKHSARAIENGG